MANQKLKGGRKLVRSGKDKGYYAQGYIRTARNKIRRLTRRLDFDPTAGKAIDRLLSRPAAMKEGK